MASAPNEPTPPSPQDGEADLNGTSGDRNVASPDAADLNTEATEATEAGVTPDLPDVDPTSDPTAPPSDAVAESSQAAPEPSATPEPDATEPDATEPAAPNAESTTVTFEDIAANASEPAASQETIAQDAVSDAIANEEEVAPSSDLAAPDFAAPDITEQTSSDDTATQVEDTPQDLENSPGESAESEEGDPELAVDGETLTGDASDRPAPTAAASGTPAAEPTASAGTVQRIWGLLQPPLSAAAKTALSTGIKGTNWLTERLETTSPAAESNQTGALGILAGVWKVIKPLLIAVTLSASRLFNQVMQWSLERIDPEAKAAVASESSRLALLITAATLGALVFLSGSLISPSSAPAETPDNFAPAPVEPTPNQALLEGIQAQVRDIISDYDGLVTAIDVDLAGDRLAVTLDDGWYRLDTQEQEQLARQMQQQATDKAFPQLTLLNQRGERIARTAVVGDGLIFFQTSKPPAPPEVPDTLEPPAEAPAKVSPPATGESAANTSTELLADPSTDPSIAGSSSPAGS